VIYSAKSCYFWDIRTRLSKIAAPPLRNLRVRYGSGLAIPGNPTRAPLSPCPVQSVRQIALFEGRNAPKKGTPTGSVGGFSRRPKMGRCSCERRLMRSTGVTPSTLPGCGAVTRGLLSNEKHSVCSHQGERRHVSLWDRGDYFSLEMMACGAWLWPGSARPSTCAVCAV
jgi:hypothetical protein